MQTKHKDKIKKALIAIGLGGSLALGANIGQPNCDYVIDDVCLTAEQAEAIIERVQGPVGFGGVLFDGGVNKSSIMEKK